MPNPYITQNPMLMGGRLGIPGGAADGGDLHAEALESFDVNRADESGADDAGAEMMKGLHCGRRFSRQQAVAASLLPQGNFFVQPFGEGGFLQQLLHFDVPACVQMF